MCTVLSTTWHVNKQIHGFFSQVLKVLKVIQGVLERTAWKEIEAKRVRYVYFALEFRLFRCWRNGTSLCHLFWDKIIRSQLTANFCILSLLLNIPDFVFSISHILGFLLQKCTESLSLNIPDFLVWISLILVFSQKISHISYSREGVNRALFELHPNEALLSLSLR